MMLLFLGVRNGHRKKGVSEGGVGDTYMIRNENANMTRNFRLDGIWSVIRGTIGKISIAASVITSIIVMIFRRRT